MKLLHRINTIYKFENHFEIPITLGDSIELTKEMSETDRYGAISTIIKRYCNTIAVIESLGIERYKDIAEKNFTREAFLEGEEEKISKTLQQIISFL